MSIEATILGRAQDAGVPQAGCVCANCTAAREGRQPREYAACLTIVDSSSNQAWLIDATPDFREQLALLPSGVRLAGFFLTHAHIGHYTGLMHLGREAMNTHRLPVHATPRMCDFLRRNAPWSQLVSFENIELHEHEPASIVQLAAGVQIEFVSVPHRSEFTDTMAFIVRGPTQSLFYCPDIDDWKTWPRDVRKLPDEFDLSIIDGTFFSPDELPGRDLSTIPHPTAQKTIEAIGSGRGKVFFTHLNHTNPLLTSESMLASIRDRGFDVVETGQSIPL